MLNILKKLNVKGFTLIELLVVIAIIAILAAILFPVFAQAREKARATTCLSNMKQIALAINMYTEDYDETLPAALFTNYTVPGTANTYTFYGIPNFLEPYMKNWGVWKCPSQPATANLGDIKGLISGNFGATYYRCQRHYTANGNALIATDFWGGATTGHKSTGFLGAVEKPANTIALMETGGLNMQFYPGDVQWAITNYWKEITPHMEGQNLSFLDGHAKYLKTKAITDDMFGNAL